MTALIFGILLYILLGVAYFLFYNLGQTTLAYILGLFGYIVAFAAMIYATVVLVRDTIRGLKINPVYLIYLPLPFIYYTLMKKFTVGVAAEAMGAKGFLPAILRIASILLGKGEPLQVLGIWIGMLTMIFGFYVAILTAAQYRGTFLDRLYLFLGAFGIVMGFVTAHLAQTGYMYPFTIMMGTMYISFYIPLYYVGLLVGIFLLPLYFKYIFFR